VGGYGGLIFRGERRADFSQFLDISVDILEELQHAELVHGDDEGFLDVMDDLSGSMTRK
jgi:hypothetical protein